MQSLSSVRLVIVTDHHYFDKHIKIDCLYLHRSQAIDDLQTIGIGMIGWMLPFRIVSQETWSSLVDETVYQRNYKLNSAANLPDPLTISHQLLLGCNSSSLPLPPRLFSAGFSSRILIFPFIRLYQSMVILTLSYLMLKSGQTYFTSLATTTKFLKYIRSFFNINYETVKYIVFIVLRNMIF